MNAPTAGPRLDVSALIWGLLFLIVATLGMVRGLGASIDWGLVGHLAPPVLITLGALGLALRQWDDP